MLLFHQLITRLSGASFLSFQVENLVKILEESGRLDKSYLVITSDHGYHMGQFGMPIDKRLPYETDIRVPLAIVPPNGLKNRKTAEELVVVSNDLAPTVLDMAGISSDEADEMDGVSLLPLLKQVSKG